MHLAFASSTGVVAGCIAVLMSPTMCYLVDPASSHMLVSKIKPCMCKYEQIQTVKLRMAQTPTPAEHRTKIRGNQRATGHRGKGEEAPPSTKENQPLSLRYFSRKYGPNRPRGPSTKKLAGARRRAAGRRWHGRQPWRTGGFPARVPRRPTFFSRKDGPNRPSGPSTKKIAGARRTAAGRRWHGRQPWRTGGFPARVPRRPTFFSRKDGPNRPSGPSTKKIAGARRTAAGRRWHGRQPWRTGGFPARVPRRPTFFSRKDGPNRPSGPSTKKIAGARRAAAGRRWHGRQPWRTGGFPARVPRRPTFFSRKDGPNRPSGPSTKKIAGARRAAAGRRWHGRQPWRTGGFPARVPRRPTFFSRKDGPNRPSGPSTKKFAGARRTAAGRWGVRPPPRGRRERKESRGRGGDARRPVVVPPPTVVAERIHRPWPSSAYIFPRKYGPIRPKRGLAGKVRRTSPDHCRRAVAGYFFGPWGWWPIEITAYGLRGP